MASFTLRLEDPDAREEDREVFKILSPFLAPGSRISPEEAAVALDKSIILLERTAEVNAFWTIWDTLNSLIRQIPYRHPSARRPFALYNALRALPPRTIDLGEHRDWHTGRFYEIWAEFPDFEWRWEIFYDGGE